jgi:hypothetical protein
MADQRNHPWISGTYDDEEKSSGRRWRPSKEKLRAMAKMSKEGGRFMCPICREYFSMTYAKFGTIRPFQPPENYCRDCAEEDPNFRKAQR